MQALRYHPRNVSIISPLGTQEVMGIKALQAAQVAQVLPLLGIRGWIMPSPQTVRAVDCISGTKLTTFPIATGSTRMPASAHGV